MSGEAKPSSWWTTLPGVITAVSGLLTAIGSFLVEHGHPLCPTPPGWRTGCYAREPQYRKNWRNTPDGYVANGKKVKTFTRRSERVFEILGTKHAFYVDDGHLYDYVMPHFA
jgi:hypothetical protein